MIRKDAGKEEYRKGWIQDRREAGKGDSGNEGCRKGESRLEGYRKGWFRTVEIRNGRDARVDRRDKGKLGGRTGGMQD